VPVLCTVVSFSLEHGTIIGDGKQFQKERRLPAPYVFAQN